MKTIPWDRIQRPWLQNAMGGEKREDTREKAFANNKPDTRLPCFPTCAGSPRDAAGC